MNELELENLIKKYSDILEKEKLNHTVSGISTAGKLIISVRIYTIAEILKDLYKLYTGENKS